MSYQPGPIEHSYLGSSVYANLRQALITGQLKPNDRLRIRELAAQVGTSVTPVRDAVLQLANEQALEMRTPKDIRVPSLTHEQYLELKTLRIELEGLGAQRAAARITPAAVQLLTVNIRRNIRAITEEDWVAALRLNSEFHLLVAQSAMMPVLSSFVDRLWMRTGPLIAQAYAQLTQQMTIGHHQELLAALRQHDGDAAAAAIRQDILDSHGILAQFTAANRPSDDLPSA
ncbi:GntR family transcriptional regulator [Acerihabitans arboris]|uniref:FCD domain-containing protein n=1 Tax=Acerihabitans arboris TaxID=2691583 RepID=A0A845SIZ4_9GAMM|nr:GntR family transcriptional regulator [Acerihabitans arboris]NDL62996.1 FCD domain-containing protein [Acerihabitans arboris]